MTTCIKSPEQRSPSSPAVYSLFIGFTISAALIFGNFTNYKGHGTLHHELDTAMSRLVSFFRNLSFKKFKALFRTSLTVEKTDPDIRELSRCCVCYETYNKTNRVPIAVPCGHTFCRQCMLKMYVSITFQCCVCREVALMGFGKIGKNLALVHFLEKANLLADDDVEGDQIEFTDSDEVTQDFQNINPRAFELHSKQYLNIIKEYINYHSERIDPAAPDRKVNDVLYASERLLASLDAYFEDSRARNANPTPQILQDAGPEYIEMEVFNRQGRETASDSRDSVIGADGEPALISSEEMSRMMERVTLRSYADPNSTEAMQALLQRHNDWLHNELILTSDSSSSSSSGSSSSTSTNYRSTNSSVASLATVRSFIETPTHGRDDDDTYSQEDLSENINPQESNSDQLLPEPENTDNSERNDTENDTFASRLRSSFSRFFQ